VSIYSIDTGINESPFQGHYFDLNAGHKAGNLLPMNIGSKLDGVEVSKLVLKPISDRDAKSSNDEL